jgi:hypothetical protein
MGGSVGGLNKPAGTGSGQWKIMFKASKGADRVTDRTRKMEATVEEEP